MGDHESTEGPPAAHGPSRRQFIERTGGAAGGVLALGVAGGLRVLADAPAAPAAPAEAAAQAALTPGELTTLRAILARLLPADASGPGAVEAGVDVYIDRALAGSYAALLPLYRTNLAAIEAAARTHGATSFAALSPAAQDALLQQVEAGKAAGLSSSTFFQVVLEHMREGMFGDPMYGGNRNFAGWDLIGYPGVQLVYTAEQQAIGTHVKPAHASATTFGGHPYNGPTA
jgi:gluconate 2-dehydrogenase gamma chain